MHHRTIATFFLVLSGCSNGSPSPQLVTEQNARLISIARSAATAEGFSLVDAIYQVRRDGDGWVVQVDKSPGYTGVGEPMFVLDGTFFVMLSHDEKVREILSYGRQIKPTTRPTGGA